MLRKRVEHGRASRLLLVAGAATALLTLSACTGGGGSSNNASTSSKSTAAAAKVSKGKADIYVIGGKSDDPFFSTVKRGVDDATRIVKAVGGSVHYLPLASYENLGPDAAKLTETAISNKASIILVPDWVPASQNPAIKEAISDGIPVIIYNSGADQVSKTGAIAYIGADDYKAGVAAGQYLAENNAKKILCVNTVPGAANLEARCDGAKVGAKPEGGKVTELPLPASNFGNPTAVTQAIKAALTKDKSITGVLTMGSQDATSAASALKQSGLTSKVALAAFNVDQSQMARIKAGTQLVAIDQQGYLQGYYSVSAAYQYMLYGLKLTSNPLLTGPSLVTKDNVSAALAGAKAGVR